MFIFINFTIIKRLEKCYVLLFQYTEGYKNNLFTGMKSFGLRRRNCLYITMVIYGLNIYRFTNMVSFFTFNIRKSIFSSQGHKIKRRKLKQEKQTQNNQKILYTNTHIHTYNKDAHNARKTKKGLYFVGINKKPKEHENTISRPFFWLPFFQHPLNFSELEKFPQCSVFILCPQWQQFLITSCL